MVLPDDTVMHRANYGESTEIAEFRQGATGDHLVHISDGTVARTVGFERWTKAYRDQMALQGKEYPMSPEDVAALVIAAAASLLAGVKREP